MGCSAAKDCCGIWFWDVLIDVNCNKQCFYDLLCTFRHAPSFFCFCPWGNGENGPWVTHTKPQEHFVLKKKPKNQHKQKMPRTHTQKDRKKTHTKTHTHRHTHCCHPQKKSEKTDADRKPPSGLFGSPRRPRPWSPGLPRALSAATRAASGRGERVVSRV